MEFGSYRIDGFFWCQMSGLSWAKMPHWSMAGEFLHKLKPVKTQLSGGATAPPGGEFRAVRSSLKRRAVHALNKKCGFMRD
jgi:hypothetical protein